MKAKKIILTFLLLIGMVSVKAQDYYYRAELAIISQPVMTYTPNSVRLYYDIQNIGDERYAGYFYIYMYPDNGQYYDREYVRIRPGRIKRVELEIPYYLFDPNINYMVSPYYGIGNELFYFTTFEYFEPLALSWRGPRTQFYIVARPRPIPHHYYRPDVPRYFYDGHRPPHDGYVNGYPYDPRYGHENHMHFGQIDDRPHNGNQGNHTAPASVNRRGSSTAGSMSERSQSQGNNSGGANVVKPNSGRDNNGSATNNNEGRTRTPNSNRKPASVNDNGSGSSSSSSGNSRSNRNSGSSRKSSTVKDGSSSSSSSSSGNSRSNSNSGSSRKSSTVKDGSSSSSSSSNSRSGSGQKRGADKSKDNQSSSSSSSGRTRNR